MDSTTKREAVQSLTDFLYATESLTRDELYSLIEKEWEPSDKTKFLFDRFRRGVFRKEYTKLLYFDKFMKLCNEAIGDTQVLK